MKLLLVEDEATIRNGIFRHIPWKQLEISEVRQAANADEAFAVFDSFLPEIVLTDIQMPGLNGIEMCRRMRDREENVQIIFLTGYVEKEYLMGAIDLHAVSYIEKPVVIEQVCEAIRKAAENSRRMQIEKEARLYQMMMQVGGVGERDFADIRYGFVMDIYSGPGVSLYELKESLEKNRDCLGYGARLEVIYMLNARTLIVYVRMPSPVVCRNRLIQMLTAKMAEQKERGGHWFAAVGKTTEGIGGIAESYQTAEELMRALAWRGWDACVFYPEERNEYRRTAQDTVLVNEFGLRMSRKEYREALELMNGFWERLIREKVMITYPVCYMANEFYRLMFPKGYGIAPDAQPEFAVDDYETLEEIRRELEKCLKKRMVSRTEEPEKQKTGFLVQKVLDYMYAHYADPELSIRVLADQVYLTPTYLSAVFKNHTDKTIGSYLTDIRMEEAKKRIRDPQYKLYEIAALVGYRDANYFTKTFKKKTGYTPSEYREAGL